MYSSYRRVGVVCPATVRRRHSRAGRRGEALHANGRIPHAVVTPRGAALSTARTY